VPELSVVTPPAHTALARLVDDYLMSCRARGLAPNTVQVSYGYPLRGVLLPWCADHGIADLAGLDARQVDAFTVHLHDAGGRGGAPLSKASVHAYLRAVRAFLGWCEKEGEAVAARPSLPRLPHRALDVLDREEISRLETAAPTERDRLIIRILGDCGLRAAELCQLTVDDVVRHDRQAFLRVHGKGERDRLVPLPPALLRRLDRYVKGTRPAEASNPRLFVALRRAPGGGYPPLTPSGVLQLVRSAAQRAGITKRIYTHLLRHSFITNALRGGMNPMMVAQVAGHTSLRMIERVYSHLDQADAYEAMIRLLTAEKA
jgi:integrase/recombinase XerD